MCIDWHCLSRFLQGRHTVDGQREQGMLGAGCVRGDGDARKDEKGGISYFISYLRQIST